MEQLNGVVERYLAVWNETDTTRRRDLVAETWTHDASYIDPLMQRDGHVGIDCSLAVPQLSLSPSRSQF